MAELIKKNSGEVVYYTSPQLTAFPDVRHAYFAREGGFSPAPANTLSFRFTDGDEKTVNKNFELAAQILGRELSDVVRTTQEHTDRVVAITASREHFCRALENAPCDALITNQKGVVLSGFFADCQLVFLYDKKNKAVGVVHSGWRGVANKILTKTIETMRETYGTLPRDITAAVGPSICRNCFETDNDVYDAMIGAYGIQIADYMYKHGEKWHIDLKNITYCQLVNSGVFPYNIDISSVCPCCSDSTLWWSHRRDGLRRGVHAGMICLK